MHRFKSGTLLIGRLLRPEAGASPAEVAELVDARDLKSLGLHGHAGSIPAFGKSFSVSARAKVNLFLDVLRKREDGFHEIASLFHPVSLSDRIEFGVADRFSLKVEVEIPGNPGVRAEDLEKGNLLEKIWLALRETTDLPPLAVTLRKRIPVGAGLGGGSSDGSAFLAAINEVFSYEWTVPDMADFSARFGSDLPFFLYGGLARVGGRGEVVEPLPVKRDFHVVLIWPGVPVPTPMAFRELVTFGTGDRLDPFLAEWKGAARLDELGRLAVNAFEAKERLALAPVAAAHDCLSTHSPCTLLSGSGSTVFALFSERDAAARAFQSARERFETVFLERLIERGWERDETAPDRS